MSRSIYVFFSFIEPYVSSKLSMYLCICLSIYLSIYLSISWLDNRYVYISSSFLIIVPSINSKSYLHKNKMKKNKCLKILFHWLSNAYIYTYIFLPFAYIETPVIDFNVTFETREPLGLEVDDHMRIIAFTCTDTERWGLSIPIILTVFYLHIKKKNNEKNTVLIHILFYRKNMYCVANTTFFPLILMIPSIYLFIRSILYIYIYIWIIIILLILSHRFVCSFIPSLYLLMVTDTYIWSVHIFDCVVILLKRVVQHKVKRTF